MRGCRQCGGELESTFRYCPWCSTPQRSKLVEFFRAHPRLGNAGALRVSRYLGIDDERRHVRFSIWSSTGEAEAALSLDDGEAERLGWFLLETGRRRVPQRPKSVVKEALVVLRRGGQSLQRLR